MRTLKLLLINKYYRWATLESIKLKFLSLPIIKHIVAWYHTYKIYKKMQGMNQWEQYVEVKNMENETKKFCFVAALIRLEACIMAEGENEEIFEQAKLDVLCNEKINEPCLKDFKKWLESITSSEKDYSRVQELINSYTSKTH